jgi:hypothetical protein
MKVADDIALRIPCRLLWAEVMGSHGLERR